MRSSSEPALVNDSGLDLSMPESSLRDARYAQLQGQWVVAHVGRRVSSAVATKLFEQASIWSSAQKVLLDFDAAANKRGRH